MKRLLISLAGISLCAAVSPVVAAPARSTPKPTPKLSMAQARAIAHKRAPGRVQKAEYEAEKGGWRYSFDITEGARIHEIGVDAMTGAIVEDAYEAPGAKD